jgi:hypothetical protein
MDMLGGLERTSSRIAIAAALGLIVGGYAMSTPAKAQGYGGDCCADLEERVAELEATTVRKGNKKVSITISGWVVKSMNWWDDGRSSNFVVGDKDYDLASRFAITGSATIAPGWSAGYNLTVTTGATTWGIPGNQFDEYSSVNGALYGNNYADINTLYSYIYVKSDTWGTLNWGHLSPASDNPAVLADISGTVIESNGVGFEGAGFLLRPKKQDSFTALTWASYWNCSSLNAPGTDCFGVAQPAVRYDSPTWGGFRFETSYGTSYVVNSLGASVARTQDENFWDFAAFYNEDWGSFKISLAGAYTWMEGNPLTGGEEDYTQVGGTLMHTPTGLGIYGYGNWESVDGRKLNGARVADTDSWGVKPFWKTNWSPLGATIMYGEYYQYNDFYGAVAGNDHCFAGFASQTGIGNYCGGAPLFQRSVTVDGSELQRWGLGVVQEVDAAAMHIWARWQHQEVDVDYIGFDNVTGDSERVRQSFDEFDFFQVGGIIFF